MAERKKRQPIYKVECNEGRKISIGSYLPPIGCGSLHPSLTNSHVSQVSQVTLVAH